MVFIFNGQPLMDEMAACESHDEDQASLGNSQADLFTCRWEVAQTEDDTQVRMEEGKALQCAVFLHSHGNKASP